MKYISYVLLFLLIIFFGGCKKNSLKKNWAEDLYGKSDINDVMLIEPISDSISFIKIKNNDFNKNLPLFEIVSEYEYVPLETVIGSEIGMIDKIIIKENLIYILDKYQAKSIFVFDWKGKLLRKLNEKGRGPGEYVSITDMSIKDDGTMVIYDSSTRKIIEYDRECKLIKEKKVAFNFSYIQCNNENFIFSTSYMSQNYHLPNLHCYNLLKTDSSFVIKNKALKYNKKNILIRTRNGSDFFMNNKQSYYHPFLSDTIYQIYNQNILAKYKIDFEGKSISRANIVNDNKLNTTDDGFRILDEEMKSSKYITHPIVFSDRFLFFYVSDKNVLNPVYYDIHKRKVYAGNTINFKGIKDMFVYSTPQVGFNNFLVGYVSAENFVKGIKGFKAQNNILSEKNEIKYSNVKSGDNPIIFFAKTK